jgi:hypothetical protein
MMDTLKHEGNVNLLMRVSEMTFHKEQEQDEALKRLLRDNRIIYASDFITQIQSEDVFQNFPQHLRAIKAALDIHGFKIGEIYDEFCQLPHDNVEREWVIRDKWRLNQHDIPTYEPYTPPFVGSEFQATSSAIPFNGWANVCFSVAPAFAEAVMHESIDFLSYGNPDEIDTNADIPVARNALNVAKAIGGDEAFFNTRDKTLVISFCELNLHLLTDPKLTINLAKACQKLMPV